MGKDPAFLFYPGDAAEDVSHMNRLERGCYFDLIQAQKKFGPLPLPTIQKILGKDFDSCWESIKMCLTYEKDMYYISWLQDSIEKRKKYSASRSKNREGSKHAKNEENASTYVEHMVNGNGNINNTITVEENLKTAFDDMYLEVQRIQWKEIDFDFELKAFRQKVLGSPDQYLGHDVGGMRLAFQFQLRNAKKKQSSEPKNKYKIQ